MKSNRTVKLFSSSVFILVLAAIALSVYQAMSLNTRYSVREFFPRNHPILKNDDLTEKNFELEESAVFLVTLSLKKSQAGTWLEKSRAEALEKVTDAVATIKGVKQVRSLANLEMAVENGSTLEIGPLLKSLPEKKWEGYIRSHALLRPQLISNDLRSVLLVLEPSSQSTEALKRIETQVLSKAGNANWTVRVGGVPAVQTRLAEKVHSEVGKFLIASLALFCLMFIAFYRNWAPVLFAALGLIVVNTTSLAWLSLFGISFTVLLSTLPIIASIAFVSLAIHTLHLWSARFGEENPVTLVEKQKLSWRVLREISLPNFLGSMTTAIGFVTLATTNIPAIRTYALVIAATVMWVWLATQILLLAFQHLFVPAPRDWNHARAHWMLRLNRHSIAIVSGTLAVAVVMGACFHHLNFSGQLFDDLSKKENVRKATDLLDQRFGGTVALDIAITANRKDAWKEPGQLRKMRRALSQIRRIPGVGSALGVTDFFNSKLPAKKTAAAEVYFLFSMSPENPLRHFVTSDFREARIAARLRDLPSNQIQSVRDQVRDILRNADPSWSLRESGLAVNSHTLNQEVAKELVYGFWQSLVIIGLLLVVIFRSLRWALMACLPNLVPPAMLIGTLAMVQTPVKPGIALIFSIALGLAFNNTVYLLSRLKRIQKEKGMKTLPLRRALLEEGNPCFSESFIMFAGFFIFLASDFKMNQTFGLYMVLSILAGALGDLVFLPAMLREFSSFLWQKNAKRAPRLRLIVNPLKDRGLSLEEKAVEEKESKNSSIAASWIVFAFLTGAAALMASPVARAADEPGPILQKARAQLESKSDQAKVKMTIIEANGEKKVRTMSLQTLRTSNGFKALVRLEAPADIKGTALLASVENGQQNQWLYLPSSKQVRRVASAKKSTGVLGSELNPEDLNPTALKGAKTRLLAKSAQSAQVEIVPARGTSEYSRVVTTFSMPDALPLKTEYYVGAKPAKVVEFLNYKVLDGKIHRAQSIRIRNLVKKRGTDLDFGDIKVNGSLSAKDFTPDALKEAW